MKIQFVLPPTRLKVIIRKHTHTRPIALLELESDTDTYLQCLHRTVGQSFSSFLP